MSSLWSNCELIYCMPSAGPSKTTNTASVVSANGTTGTAFQMPALNSIWPISGMIGKAINVQAAGIYDSGTAYAVTTALYLDTTQGTETGTLVAATGAASTWPAAAAGGWYFNVTLTCVGTSISSNADTSAWYVTGNLMAGAANNAATTTASAFMMGSPSSSGAASTVALPTQASIGYLEIWSTWATAPTAQVCTQFLVFAEN